MTRIAQTLLLAMATFGLGILVRETSEALAVALGILALAVMLVAVAIIAAEWGARG